MGSKHSKGNEREWMESKNILDVETTMFGNIKLEPGSGMEEGTAFFYDWWCSCYGSNGGGEEIARVINLEVAVRLPLGTFHGGSFMVIWNAEKEVWNRELDLTIITLP